MSIHLARALDSILVSHDIRDMKLFLREIYQVLTEEKLLPILAKVVVLISVIPHLVDIPPEI